MVGGPRSKTQACVALSSGEAELYAINKGVAEGIGLRNLISELGRRCKVRLSTDSSAAKSFVARRGLGRMRHIEVRDLWLQQEVAKGLVEVRKIPGETNPADLMTKHLLREALDKWPGALKVPMGIHFSEKIVV